MSKQSYRVYAIIYCLFVFFTTMIYYYAIKLKKYHLQCSFNFLVAPELVTIHLKLLRRIYKSVSTERWEKVLTKITHRFSSQDAWEIERFGYKKSRTVSKVRILKVKLVKLAIK